MEHLFAPGRESHHDHAQIHFAGPGGQELLCGHGQVYKTIDGEKYRIWCPTKRAVTCGSCIKRLELLTRMQLGELDSVQLEALLDHIGALRNGHPENG